MPPMGIALTALALSVPPVPPDSEAPVRADAHCLPIQASSASGTAEGLASQGVQAMAAGDAVRAEALFRQSLDAQGSDVVHARSVRMLIDLRTTRGDLDEMERVLACPELRSEAWTHARAWLAYRDGRYDDAAALLAPLVRPRHHTQPRWSIVHEHLGDAFARLGRLADAQAQWRIALATDYDPGGTGWSRETLERKLAQSLTAEGAEPMLPLQRYADAVSILDVTSVQRTAEGVRYDKLVLLQNDEPIGAYGIDSWEVDCDAPRARVLAVHGFDSSGGPVRQIDDPGAWRDDQPGEPWLPTERKLVCSIETDLRITPRRKSDVEMLRAYRSGAPIFE